MNNKGYISKVEIEDIINNFNEEKVAYFKSKIACYLRNDGKKQSHYSTEKEIENKSFVALLKKGEGQEYLGDIVEDIREQICIEDIDYITYTPDSGNAKEDILHATMKGFSFIVEELAKLLEKPTILPTITRIMEKQKTTKGLKGRLDNKIGGYSFDKNFIEGKNILFIDDVITTGATTLAIMKDITEKGGNCFGYCIADAKQDKENKNS